MQIAAGEFLTTLDKLDADNQNAAAGREQETLRLHLPRLRPSTATRLRFPTRSW